MPDNLAMKQVANHAVRYFNITVGDWVMAAVIRTKRDLSELGSMFRWGPYGTCG